MVTHTPADVKVLEKYEKNMKANIKAQKGFWKNNNNNKKIIWDTKQCGKINIILKHK